MSIFMIHYGFNKIKLAIDSSIKLSYLLYLLSQCLWF